MRHLLSLGVVSSYPPSPTASAADTAELVRSLTTEDTTVVVCAVGRPGSNYPDEVLVSVAVDDPADYGRGARLLAEHGVDVAVIRFDDGVFGGLGGSYVRELVTELRRHGVAVAVSLPRIPPDPGASWTRTVTSLTAVAAAVLVATPEDRDVALARRLATADRLRVGVEAAALAGGPRCFEQAAPPIRTDWLDRDLAGLRSFHPDRDARLAVVAARLLALPPAPLAPAGWSAATGWAGRSVRALGSAVQVSGAPSGFSRAVRGLGAIASGTGVPDRLRHRAGVLRAMLVAAEPADLPAAADIILGLAHDGRLADVEWAALAQRAVRLDEARREAGRGRGAAWPCFADRLHPGDIRLAHALLVAGARLSDDAMLGRGLESVDWLARRAGLSAVDGVFVAPVAGPRRATEVGDYVEALVAAYRETGAVRHARMAHRAMAWFHGANAANAMVYDEAVGACRAGIGPTAGMATLSTNATLAHLAATLALNSVGLARLPAAELSRQDLATVA
jgi:hypothetical protein